MFPGITARLTNFQFLMVYAREVFYPLSCSLFILMIFYVRWRRMVLDATGIIILCVLFAMWMISQGRRNHSSRSGHGLTNIFGENGCGQAVKCRRMQ